MQFTPIRICAAFLATPLPASDTAVLARPPGSLIQCLDACRVCTVTLVPIPVVVAAGEDASIRYRFMMPPAVKLCNRVSVRTMLCIVESLAYRRNLG